MDEDPREIRIHLQNTYMLFYGVTIRSSHIYDNVLCGEVSKKGEGVDRIFQGDYNDFAWIAVSWAPLFYSDSDVVICFITRLTVQGVCVLSFTTSDIIIVFEGELLEREGNVDEGAILNEVKAGESELHIDILLTYLVVAPCHHHISQVPHQELVQVPVREVALLYHIAIHSD